MAKRMFGMYPTYSFKEKDPVIDELRSMIAEEGLSYKQIHEVSGVSKTTLYNWFSGDTRRPQHASVMAVVRMAGYDYKLVKVGKILQLKRRAG